MSAAWRLLVDGPADGPWNMGVDEALLATAARGGRASLRFYTWKCPWLSLGYGQRVGAELRTRCEAAGVGVVRRTTGGRAVLHGADLTYAVAAAEPLLPAGLDASYARIAAGLVSALEGLGVAVEARAGRATPGRPGFDCFAEPAAHELCAGGRKLVGSAQRRAHGAVLQHGSIRLEPDPGAASAAAGLSPELATSLRELGLGLGPAELAERVAEGLAKALGVELEPGRLDPAEADAASKRGAEPTPPAPPLPEGSRGEPQGAPAQADR